MSAVDLSWRRDDIPCRAAGPAALVVAPPASLPRDGCGAEQLRKTHIVPRTHSESHRTGPDAEVACSIGKRRAQHPHPHPDGTMVAQSRSDSRAARPLSRNKAAEVRMSRTEAEARENRLHVKTLREVSANHST